VDKGATTSDLRGSVMQSTETAYIISESN